MSTEADQDRREALYARYGRPSWLGASEEGVYAFGHSSQESAEAFAASNRENQDYPAWTEQRDGTWVSVVDLRPRMAEVQASFQEASRG